MERGGREEVWSESKLDIKSLKYDEKLPLRGEGEGVRREKEEQEEWEQGKGKK
jgi:hypothetical protein